MRTNIFILTAYLFFQAASLQACLNTYQFKIFPIGMLADTIVTIDVQIQRTSQAEGNRWLDLRLDSADEWTEMWIVNAFISKYDKNQNCLSKEFIAETYSLDSTYLDSLKMIYHKGYNNVLSQYPAIRIFRSEYISYCVFQHSCNLVKLSNNAATKTDYITYQTKMYPIKALRDTAYYALNKSDHISDLLSLYVNSIRIYKLDNFELVISHLTTGHEISMGWFTSDPKVAKKREANDEPVILSQEYKPEIAFTDLYNAVYEEPLLHHAFGVDLFILKN